MSNTHHRATNDAVRLTYRSSKGLLRLGCSSRPRWKSNTFDVSSGVQTPVLDAAPVGLSCVLSTPPSLYDSADRLFVASTSSPCQGTYRMSPSRRGVSQTSMRGQGLQRGCGSEGLPSELYLTRVRNQVDQSRDRATYDPSLTSAAKYTIPSPGGAPLNLTYGPSCVHLSPSELSKQVLRSRQPVDRTCHHRPESPTEQP